MRALRLSLHDDLMRSIDTITFKKQFQDHILASMVTEAQRSGPSGEMATVLLWLALWPGLDALYRRLFRYFAKAPDEWQQAGRTDPLSDEEMVRFGLPLPKSAISTRSGLLIACATA